MSVTGRSIINLIAPYLLFGMALGVGHWIDHSNSMLAVRIQSFLLPSTFIDTVGTTRGG
jgi:hypothetical protein